MKVINAGLGRTGTHSLKAAFDILGLAPCYSAEMMWNEPGHQELWSATCAGKPIDWHALFASYESGLDWPVCSFWREIVAAFPDVRVVLSTRDPEDWYASFRETVYAALTSPLPASASSLPVVPVFQRLPTLGAKVIAHNFTDDLASRDAMIAAYHRHNAAVRAAIPPGRLLEWRLTDGWAPLCAFLDRPRPARPFPHVNDRRSYRELLGLPV
ncbi:MULTISPECIES: sulfotransferase family protein [Actinomadura]|uniref:Sulfotransferase family protein n=1 Tax=Actinomadura yumaensis TaxID=111807 RepID=A0ABW2CIT5_9ACTN|nr:sulfotransferase family protein [Actinomadura sp. J1-007]MWK34993.1 sulfotransferase family protein [Actinomadura sp. J1-007]